MAGFPNPENQPSTRETQSCWIQTCGSVSIGFEEVSYQAKGIRQDHHEGLCLAFLSLHESI